MIILENSDPNFVLKKDTILMTECGKIIDLSKGEFLSISKLHNDFVLSDYYILPKELKEKFFKDMVNNISHVQLEERLSDDLNLDGMFLQEYINEDFDLETFEFPNYDTDNVILSELKRISSLN